MTIAALYVATGGCYFGLPDVDPWDEARDARLYAGPHPVVAHPPCGRWGAYWWGGPSAKVRFELGADGGCFAAALASVRKWGGGIGAPGRLARMGALQPEGAAAQRVGAADIFGGFSCAVEQGHYGHKARKPTWLYACGVELPALVWGVSAAVASIDGSKNRRHRARGVRSPNDTVECLGKKARAATPLPFRDLLVSIAKTAARSALKGTGS